MAKQNEDDNGVSIWLKIGALIGVLALLIWCGSELVSYADNRDRYISKSEYSLPSASQAKELTNMYLVANDKSKVKDNICDEFYQGKWDSIRLIAKQGGSSIFIEDSVCIDNGETQCKKETNCFDVVGQKWITQLKQSGFSVKRNTNGYIVSWAD